MRVNPARILGLDPGSRVTGWGLLVIGPTGKGESAFGCLRPPRHFDRSKTLAALSTELAQLLERTSPTVVVVETPFSARFLKAGLVLAETRGALLAVLGGWGGTVVEYEPARVKAAVVGLGRAEKRQVAYVVQRELGIASTLSSDAADALALALCHFRLSKTASLQAPPAVGTADRVGGRVPRVR
ncbi:MAG: crossover junction endodeoxyribonuclease RuvC [Acidobacteriota bacterium]